MVEDKKGSKKKTAVTAKPLVADDAKKRRTLWSDKWPKHKKVLWVLLLVAWTGGSLIASQLVVVLGWRLIAHGSNFGLSDAAAQTVLSGLVYVLTAFLVIVVPTLALKLEKSRRDELGLHGLPTWTDLLLAPCGYIVFMIVAMLLIAIMQALPLGIDWEQAQELGYDVISSTSDRLMAFLALVIFAPVAEELVFRGWLYAKLRAHLKAVPAILIVSALFGLMHGQWNVGITVGVMSIAMCVMRELTGTIYAGILIHMIKNGLAYYLLFVNPSLFGG